MAAYSVDRDTERPGASRAFAMQARPVSKMVGCSAQLVRVAACWSVHQHAADIQDFVDAAAERRHRTSWDETTSGTETHVAHGIIEQRIKQMCPERVNANAL